MMRALSNSFFIAGRYLSYHRIRTAILVTALAVILFVPVFLEMIVSQSREQLTARADDTPLILGSPGSSLDLAMSGLYFVTKQPAPITYGDALAIDKTGQARTIPLHTGFRVGDFRIIGTTLDYFDHRHLTIAQGRQMAVLGEAVVGATAARKLKVGPGDSLVSTPENFIDIAGQYPLKMKIAGILSATGTADDEAVLVDLRTSWIIAGLGHGHQDLTKNADASVILKSSASDTITANAKLLTYIEITPDNVASFHFHGDNSGFPISSAIVVPKDEKAKALLLGRYQTQSQPLQLIRPPVIMQELIDAIFRIKAVLDVVVIVVAFSTALTILLVFILSLRLRARELTTIFRLGCGRLTTAGFVIAELFLIASASLVLSALLLAITNHWGNSLLVQLLQER
jgi:putative ABC transport system permease protein